MKTNNLPAAQGEIFQDGTKASPEYLLARIIDLETTVAALAPSPAAAAPTAVAPAVTPSPDPGPAANPV